MPSSAISSTIEKIKPLVEEVIQAYRERKATTAIGSSINPEDVFPHVIQLFGPLSTDFKITQEDIVKLRAHLSKKKGQEETVVDGKSKRTEFEGWWADKWLFMRCWNLFYLIVRLEITIQKIAILIPDDMFQGPLKDRKNSLEKLYSELAITIEAEKNLLEVLKITQSKQDVSALAQRIAQNIQELDDKQEYMLAAQCLGMDDDDITEKGHLVYVAFRREGSDIKIIIYNRGCGIGGRHYRVDGRVAPRQLRIVPIWNFVSVELSYLINILENTTSFFQRRNLGDILQKGVYGGLEPTVDAQSQLQTGGLHMRKEQTGGHCVVAGWLASSYERLGSVLYKDQKKYEKSIISALRRAHKKLKEDGSAHLGVRPSGLKELKEEGSSHVGVRYPSRLEEPSSTDGTELQQFYGELFLLYLSCLNSFDPEGSEEEISDDFAAASSDAPSVSTSKMTTSHDCSDAPAPSVGGSEVATRPLLSSSRYSALKKLQADQQEASSVGRSEAATISSVSMYPTIQTDQQGAPAPQINAGSGSFFGTVLPQTTSEESRSLWSGCSRDKCTIL